MADTDVYRFQVGRPSQPVLFLPRSSMRRRGSHPTGFGSRFARMRSGDTVEIWLAHADGSNPQQLTHGPGHAQGSPWWSPDGRRIAFDSFAEDGHSHIWIIDAEGGTPHQLTNDPGDQNVPTWSRDGRWIYFSADKGPDATFGACPPRVARRSQSPGEAAGFSRASRRTARALLYQPKDADSPLLALPLSGGAPRQLVACVKPSAFATGPQGVYYVACDSSPDPALHVIDPEDGPRPASRTTGEVRNNPSVLPLGLAVSPEACRFCISGT